MFPTTRRAVFMAGSAVASILFSAVLVAQVPGPGHALRKDYAMEWAGLHTYSLIHDDLPAMVDDDMRRGRPSCHAKYGEATAILAGDALLAQAFEVLATAVEPPAVAARCVAELAKAAGACQLVGGQEDDLKAEFSDLGLEQLEAIHRRTVGAGERHVHLRVRSSAQRDPEVRLAPDTEPDAGREFHHDLVTHR